MRLDLPINYARADREHMGRATQVSVRARMQTGGRSHEQRRRLTPNKKWKDGISFLWKDVPVRGLVALPACSASTAAAGDRYRQVL